MSFAQMLLQQSPITQQRPLRSPQHSPAAPASSLLYIPGITTAVSPTAHCAFNWHCASNLRSVLDSEVALMGREMCWKDGWGNTSAVELCLNIQLRALNMNVFRFHKATLILSIKLSFGCHITPCVCVQRALFNHILIFWIW